MTGQQPDHNPIERAKGRDRFWVETAILEFTEEVSARMQTLGVNKSQMADRLQVRPAFITKLLRGNNNFTIETMVKACRALDADLRTHLQPHGATSRWFDVLKQQAAQPQVALETWGTDDFTNIIHLRETTTSHEPIRATA
jgi:plasmid maintenance system antidote protein VapI